MAYTPGAVSNWLGGQLNNLLYNVGGLTPGSWSVNTFKLPEFGVTEAFASDGTTTSPTSSSPSSTINSSSPGTYNPVTGGYNLPTSGASSSGGTGGDILGANTSGGQPSPDINQLINEAFDPTFSYLNQLRSNVTSQQPGVEQDITNQYNTSRSTLEGERTSGLNQIGQAEQSTFNRNQDAASAARRLYDELVRGGRQRFGGATSAGQAYGELTATEQQRRMGGIQTQYNEAMSKIDLAKNDLNMKFTSALSDLENQKNSALNDARRFFQDKLTEIDRMKGEAESNKAQPKLQELLNLRNMVAQINTQAYTYAQQLAANKQASEAQVEQARQRAIQSITGGNTAYSNFLSGTTTQPGTNLAMGYNPTASTYTPTGSVRRRDEYTA